MNRQWEIVSSNFRQFAVRRVPVIHASSNRPLWSSHSQSDSQHCWPRNGKSRESEDNWLQDLSVFSSVPKLCRAAHPLLFYRSYMFEFKWAEQNGNIKKIKIVKFFEPLLNKCTKCLLKNFRRHDGLNHSNDAGSFWICDEIVNFPNFHVRRDFSSHRMILARNVALHYRLQSIDDEPILFQVFKCLLGEKVINQQENTRKNQREEKNRWWVCVWLSKVWFAQSIISFIKSPSPQWRIPDSWRSLCGIIKKIAINFSHHIIHFNTRLRPSLIHTKSQ